MSAEVTWAVWKVIRGRRLSSHAKLVLLAMADVAAPDGRGWTTAQNLAVITGLTVRSVGYARHELATAGLIVPNEGITIP